jgi:hypothetical protein
VAIDELWSKYKNTPIDVPDTNATAMPVDKDDEWATDDTAVADQLKLYELEPHSKLLIKDSPIAYWVSKQSIWPQLAQMALDVYLTPAMSDEPERIFSVVSNLMILRRRCMKGEGVEQMTCLRS